MLEGHNRHFDTDSRLIVLTLLLLSFLAVGKTYTYGADPIQQANDNSQSVVKIDPMALLRQLSKKHPVLSSDNTSLVDQFLIHYLFAVPLPDGSEGGWQGVVVRDKDKCAMTVRTLDGVFFAYCTNDLFITVDQSDPNELVLQEKGFAPQVFVGADPTDGGLLARYGATDRKPSVTFDFGSLLASFSPKIIRSSYAPETQVISFSTAHLDTDVALSDKTSLKKFSFPIKTWINSRGRVVSAVFISPLSTATLDYFSVSKAILLKKQIQFRGVKEGEMIAATFYPGFGAGGVECRAAAALRSLLQVGVATTHNKPLSAPVDYFGKDDILNVKDFLP